MTCTSFVSPVVCLAIVAGLLCACAPKAAVRPADPFYLAGPPHPSVDNPPRDPDDPNGGAN